MKTIITTEVVKCDVTKYVAEDGKIFENQELCREYESTQERKIFITEMKKLEVHIDYKEYSPFNGGENYEYKSYAWFKVDSEVDVQVINNALNIKISIDSFPEHICIESCENWEDIELNDDYYHSNLSDDISYVKELSSKLGFKATFTPVSQVSTQQIYGFYETNTNNGTPETVVSLYSSSDIAKEKLEERMRETLEIIKEIDELDRVDSLDDSGYALIQCHNYHIEYGLFEQEVV